MVRKYKRVKEPSSIGSSYNPELINRLSSYSELIEVDRTKLVSSLIAEALEGRILNNDFIDLDRPYYFNYHKLIHEGTAEATTEKPVIDSDKLFILKKVPNNLDRPNKTYGTYSYSEDKPSVHKVLNISTKNIHFIPISYFLSRNSHLISVASFAETSLST